MSTDTKPRQRIERLRQSRAVILPSMLLCDFGNLAAEVARLEAVGVQALHLDVMDGHFVPNLTYGMPIVEAVRRLTDLPLDVHLMIANPRQYIRQFADAGADILTVHAEIEDNVTEILQDIQRLGIGAGLAVNPGTELQGLEAAIDSCDLFLAMSVQPGFGGQAFNPVALDKLRRVRQQYPTKLLEIDGGINQKTIADARDAGATLFVVGSAIFGQPNYGQAVGALEAQLGEQRAVD
ncbi:MAG: ribulose-phosphate 3-epimerase [Pirellulaceae bacterium]|nr:MAG: ribulose-phosphate 3-epimerase [Pirellulaceae bacterium]